MAVGVEAKGVHALEKRRDGFDEAGDGVFVGHAELRRHGAGVEDVAQVGERGVPRVETDAVPGRVAGADGVQAGNEPAQVGPFVRRGFVQGPAAFFRKHREPDSAAVVEEGAGGIGQRGNDGHFGLVQFLKEIQLVLQGVAAPAARPVELGDRIAAVRQADLVDAVDVAVHGAAEIRAGDAHRVFDGINHRVGRQAAEVRRRFPAAGFRLWGSSHAATLPQSARGCQRTGMPAAGVTGGVGVFARWTDAAMSWRVSWQKRERTSKPGDECPGSKYDPFYAH